MKLGPTLRTWANNGSARQVAATQARLVHMNSLTPRLAHQWFRAIDHCAHCATNVEACKRSGATKSWRTKSRRGGRRGRYLCMDVWRDSVDIMRIRRRTLRAPHSLFGLPFFVILLNLLKNLGHVVERGAVPFGAVVIGLSFSRGIRPLFFGLPCSLTGSFPFLQFEPTLECELVFSEF